MMNFRYLDSAYIELLSDISFVPKLGSLEGKDSLKDRGGKKSLSQSTVKDPERVHVIGS